MIKKIATAALALLVTVMMGGCWAAGYSNQGSEYVQSGSKFLGSFSGESISGGEFLNRSAFNGHKLTLIYLWATYDSAGIRQFDTIDELYSEYKDQGFNVIGVACNTRSAGEGISGKKLTRAEKEIADHKLTYVNIVPSEELVGKLHTGIEVMPTGIFVDDNGKQVGRDVGGVKKIDEWTGYVEDYLDGKDDSINK